MIIQDRCYSSKIHRPMPVIFIDSENLFFIIVTSWGLPEHSQKVIEEFHRYIVASQAEVEVTSPFEFLTCYPDDVNHLRVATLLTNQFIFRQENQSEYTAGLELLAGKITKNQLSWVQVGGPSLLINKPLLGIVPITVNQDMSMDFNSLTPLPRFLLGVERTCDIKLGFFRYENTDQLIFLASSIFPSCLLSSERKFYQLSDLSQKIISTHPEMPFWIGLK